jgi:predicted peroxiredoxin
MRGLTIIIAGADAARLHAAVSLAAAQAALGQSARIFFHNDAVALLRHPIVGPDDLRHRQAGVPTLAELIDEALALGVALIACQSGLALAGLSPADLPAQVQYGGLVGLLRQAADDRLLMA